MECNPVLRSLQFTMRKADCPRIITPGSYWAIMGCIDFEYFDMETCRFTFLSKDTVDIEGNLCEYQIRHGVFTATLVQKFEKTSLAILLERKFVIAPDYSRISVLCHRTSDLPLLGDSGKYYKQHFHAVTEENIVLGDWLDFGEKRVYPILQIATMTKEKKRNDILHGLPLQTIVSYLS